MLLDRSAIVVAGGFSRRFGQDKGLLPLAGRPLLVHVLEAVGKIVSERLLVVSSDAQAERYSKVIDSDVKVFVDPARVSGPLVGAATGFENACGKYSVLLPCDMPLISQDVLSLLLELCINKSAAIPRWPNGYIEPFHAVYHTASASEAAAEALSAGELNMRAMVEKLRGVRYVSTLVLEQLDERLETFFNVNTSSDLKKAQAMLESKRKTRSEG